MARGIPTIWLYASLALANIYVYFTMPPKGKFEKLIHLFCLVSIEWCVIRELILG